MDLPPQAQSQAVRQRGVGCMIQNIPFHVPQQNKLTTIQESINNRPGAAAVQCCHHMDSKRRNKVDRRSRPKSSHFCEISHTGTYNSYSCHLPDPASLPINQFMSQKLYFTSFSLRKHNKILESSGGALEDLRDNKDLIATLCEAISDDHKSAGDCSVFKHLPPANLSVAILEQALTECHNAEDTSCITAPPPLSPTLAVPTTTNDQIHSSSLQTPNFLHSTTPTAAATPTSTTTSPAPMFFTFEEDLSSSFNSSISSRLRSQSESVFTDNGNEITVIAETERFMMLGKKPQIPHHLSFASKIVMKSSSQWDNSALIQFFNNSTCYDLMPDNSRVVVLDTQLPVGKAFRAIVQNGLHAAPLWNSVHSNYIGMFTVTDFIRIFLHYHKLEAIEDQLHMLEENLLKRQSSNDEETIDNNLSSSQASSSSSASHISPHKLSRDILLEKGTIDYWMKRMYNCKENEEELNWQNWQNLNPEHSLLAVIHMLKEHRLHRLPVVNEINGNLQYVASYKRILAYLHLRLPLLPMGLGLRLPCDSPFLTTSSLWGLRLGQCQDFLGVWHPNLVCIKPDHSLVHALRTILTHKVSALPVVDNFDKFTLIDLYSQFDFMYIGSSAEYKRIDITVAEAVKIRDQYRGVNQPKVLTCFKSDSIFKIFDTLVHHSVSRLVVVEIIDNVECVVGLITASNLLQALALPFDRRYSAPGRLDDDRHPSLVQ